MLIFKPKRGIKYFLKLSLRFNYKAKLLKLQKHINETPIPYTIELNDKEVFVIFDESLLNEPLKLVPNRYISLDLNPNHIGMIVVNGNEILKKLAFDLSDLTTPLENLRKKKRYLN